MQKTRREIIKLVASFVALLGGLFAAIPFFSSLKPDKGVQAAGTLEVDLSSVKEGDVITVMWRGTPIFIWHRTQNQIDDARNANLSDLKDPQTDEERTKSGYAQWLVTKGVCTHLGCVPVSGKGNFGGWFCPCHGSDYDTSGRIRKGPAPYNLEIPPYKFISDARVIIGEEA